MSLNTEISNLGSSNLGSSNLGSSNLESPNLESSTILTTKGFSTPKEKVRKKRKSRLLAVQSESDIESQISTLDISESNIKSQTPNLNISKMLLEEYNKWLDTVHTMDLSSVDSVSFGKSQDKKTLSLIHGEYTMPSKIKDEPARVFSYGRPLDNLSFLEHKRYFLICFIVECQTKKLTLAVKRLIEATIFINRLEKGIDFSEGKSCINVKRYNGNATSILIEIWNANQKLNNNKLVIVGEKTTAPKYFEYSKSVPSYTNLLESEALHLVKNWLFALFRNNPVGEFDTPFFYQGFLKQLSIDSKISTEEWLHEFTPPGKGFSNGYLKLEKNQAIPKLIPYSQDFNSGNLTANTPYSFPRTDEKGKMVMSNEVKTFLKVITNGNKYRSNVIRGFMRAIITAKEEGRNWESALYVYGPPACGKSQLIEIFRKLVNDNSKVQEFSRTQNQFTSGQLEHCSLLIVSDLIDLTIDQLKILKVILGRDSVALQKKRIQGIETIYPYCQVVFVSNLSPESFPVIANDLAFLEKLIRCKFTQKEIIPSKLQTANVSAFIDSYIAEIYNWALYSPPAILNRMIRAKMYSEFFDKDLEEGGLTSFLEQCFWWDPNLNPKDVAFTSITEILPKAEEYYKNTGDDPLNLGKGTKRKGLFVGKRLQECLKEYFGLITSYTKKRTIATTRPMGFYNLVLKVKDSLGSEIIICPKDYKPLVLSVPLSANNLTPTLMIGEGITWYKKSQEDLTKNQIAILLDREINYKSTLYVNDFYS